MRPTKAGAAEDAASPTILLYSMGHNDHPHLMTCGVPCPPLDWRAGSFAGHSVFTCCMKSIREELRKKFRWDLDFAGEGLCDLRPADMWMCGVARKTSTKATAPLSIMYFGQVYVRLVVGLLLLLLVLLPLLEKTANDRLTD